MGLPLGPEALLAAAGAEGEDEVREGAEEGAEEEGQRHRRQQRDEVEPVRQLLPHRARHEPLLRQHLLRVKSLQGCTKRLFQGCVKLGENIAFCLPTVGRRTQFSNPYSYNPGRAF